MIVESDSFSLKAKARVSENIGEKTLFMPFHFVESPANILTEWDLDPEAKIPELKIRAVNIKRAWP